MGIRHQRWHRRDGRQPAQVRRLGGGWRHTGGSCLQAWQGWWPTLPLNHYSAPSLLPPLPLSPSRSLLVLLNPASGRRRAQRLYAADVAPLFAAAGISTTVRETRRPRHAAEMAEGLTAAELRGIDGQTAAAAVLNCAGESGGMQRREPQPHSSLVPLPPTPRHRVRGRGWPLPRAAKRPADCAGPGGGGGPRLSCCHRAAGAAGARAAGTHSGRVHRRSGLCVQSCNLSLCRHACTAAPVPHAAPTAPGPTPAAGTLHGSRSAFTAAAHVVLGDCTALDVLRVDGAAGTTWASCIAGACGARPLLPGLRCKCV